MISIAPTLRRKLILACVGLVILGACEKDEILPGKREDLRSVLDAEEGESAPQKFVNESRPISLPAQQTNANWPQSIGSTPQRTENATLGTALQLIWSAPIGEGDSRKFRITADPVVADGRIFTLDAKTTVTATSTGGAILWQRVIPPARNSDNDGTGGGLAVEGGRLYVSLGYGEVAALDAATGTVIWTQLLDATGSGSPSVVGDIVYLVAGDDSGWAIDKNTGRVKWQIIASTSIANVLGAPAPAVTNDLAIFSFGSGEIQAVFRRGGLQRWSASVTGSRPGRAISGISDVTAPPVIKGNSVYVGNHSGRIVSLNLGNGERNWTAHEGALSAVWPVGNSVFAVTDTNELVRLNAADGERVWGVKLPNYVKQKPKKRAEIYANYGPIVAGGRVIVTSNDGILRSFDPTNGALVGSVQMPSGATTAPVVAGGVLYVVGNNGQLHAFR
jgi:outer membrane protein assembly factor BamB